MSEAADVDIHADCKGRDYSDLEACLRCREPSLTTKYHQYYNARYGDICQAHNFKRGIISRHKILLANSSLKKVTYKTAHKGNEGLFMALQLPYQVAKGISRNKAQCDLFKKQGKNRESNSIKTLVGNLTDFVENVMGTSPNLVVPADAQEEQTERVKTGVELDLALLYDPVKPVLMKNKEHGIAFQLFEKLQKHMGFMVLDRSLKASLAPRRAFCARAHSEW